MDKSNEILFNESALYSLKRAQLTALCKRYSLKQSGKNEELVSRLQIYAQSLLNKDKQSSDTTTSNDADGARDPQGSARTSQQWEIVEDGGEEDTAMNNPRSRTMSMRSAMSIGTLKSLGSGKDFAMGSVSSKSSGSVSSSLMSIANSLKRAGSKSSKMSTSTSRTTSSIDSIVKQPMAHLFPTVPSNIPCNVDKEASEGTETNPTIVISEDQQDVDRPIAESVIDASKLQKEQSTIRLVTPAAARLKANAFKAAAFATPKLKPYSLSVSEDPKEDIGNAFLAMDDGKSDIGNAFLAMDGHSFTETAHSEIDGPNTSLPLSEVTTQEATTSLTPKKSTSTKEGLTVTTPQFVFGSPANAVSNAEFGNAAAAILEEMNKRLGLTADAPAAMKIGADGAIDFGELTPSGKSTLNISKPKFDDARFGRAHEKVFQRMDSIADHYSARRPPSPVKAGPLIGTKRKSMAAFGEDNGPRVGANKRIICLDDPKDKTAMPPPPKRQRVDGADLAKMEKASVAAAPSITIKEDEAALKKAARARRSSKGRTSTGGSAARRRSAAPPPKVAPSGRFGLLRGAAKVMKNIISTVSNGGQIPASSSKAVSTKPPVPKLATTSAPVPSTTASAPVPAPKAKQSLAPVVTRPSSLAPRASATASANTRKASQSTTSSTRTSLASKPSVPPVTRAPRMQRGSLPVFDAPAPAAKNASSDSAPKRASVAPLAIAKKTSAASRTSVVPSTASSRRPSAATGASIRSTASRMSTTSSVAPKAKVQEKQEPKPEPAAASLASKLTLDSVQESPIKPGPVSRDPDFDPAPAAEDDGSRPSSPLPAPPASLSSRPLQRRQPLEPLQPDSSNPAEGKGSLGRRPRISRSKVIAKVHANRLAAEPVTSSVKGPNKGRKSGGASLSAKAKLMGGEGGVKGRASVAAAAEAAKRKARLSNAASARRRTVAVQQAAAQV